MSAPAFLVVGDDPAALEAILAPLGARIVRARSQEEAQRLLQAEDFAAVLVDPRMPGLGSVLHSTVDDVARGTGGRTVPAPEDAPGPTPETAQRKLPEVPGVSLSASPGAGGDWYDALQLPGGRLGLVVGDVAGRGVEVAARVGELRAVARAYALEGHAPAEVLRRMNAYQLATGSNSMSTVLVAVIEPDRGRARFAAAGHPPPVLVPPPGAGAEPELVPAHGPSLGVLEVGHYEEREVPLPPGAMLALYTDGLVERRGEALDVGLERLRRALAAAASADVVAARTGVLDACLRSTGEDDATLVVVRAQERLGSPASYTLTPDPEALGSMRRHLRRWLDETTAHPAEAAEITMAVNEAMQNAIEHGNAHAVAPITVSLEDRDGEIVVTVHDLGHEASRSPDPDRGRGIQLMSALMDDARVELGGPMGGAVTLRRRLVRSGALRT